MENKQSKWLLFSGFVISLLCMAACNMGGSNSGGNNGGNSGGGQNSVLTVDMAEDTDCSVALDLRFFDKTAGNLEWPGNGEIYVLNEPGQQQQFSLSCTTGHQVCYGASYYPSTDAPAYWGVGIDGTEGCATCCYTCGDQTVNAPSLSCTVGPEAADRRGLRRRLAPSLKRLD